MIRSLFPAFLLALTTCASPNAGDCPVDLDLMVPVMTELHLAEALAKETPGPLQDSMQQVYFDNVLDDHALSREHFDSMMWIIRQEPIWVDSLYTRVNTALAKLETEL